MEAREEVNRGARKKIGNGKSTRIWEDAWIQECKGGKLNSPKPPGCQISKMSELISNFKWNTPIIFRIFSSKEVGKILKMPISLAS